jgi:hypothetical protein
MGIAESFPCRWKRHLLVQVPSLSRIGVRGHNPSVVASHHTGSNLGTAWVQLRGKLVFSFT